MKHIVFYIPFILISLALSTLRGQEALKSDKEHPFHNGHVLGLNIEYGSVIPTNEYIRGEYEGGNAISNYSSFSFAFGWQSRGEKLWQQLYGNPTWGMGIYHASFERPDDLGAPWALFGFYEGPFKRWERISIRYLLRMGMSGGWIPFDAVDNPYQISIGANSAFYASLRIFAQYKISRSFDLNAGILFSHFSNGSTSKPNKGINLFSPTLGISYNLRNTIGDAIPMIIPKYKKNWEWLAAFMYGKKMVAFDTTYSPKEIDRRYVGINCNIFGLTSTIYWQFSHKSKIGAGVDFFYDESINTAYDMENGVIVQDSGNLTDQIAIGLYPSYELVVNKLSFFVQSGFYIVRKKQLNDRPPYYQRLGMKYHVIKNLFLGVNIKAYNFQVADFVEWNAGYRLQWRRTD